MGRGRGTSDTETEQRIRVVSALLTKPGERSVVPWTRSFEGLKTPASLDLPHLYPSTIIPRLGLFRVGCSRREELVPQGATS